MVRAVHKPHTFRDHALVVEKPMTYIKHQFRSFLDECRDAGLSSGILILKSLYRVCPNLIPHQGCAAPVFRVKSQSDKSHCYCFSR